MIGGLRSVERHVERLGQNVRADLAVLDEAGRRVADRVRRELARPKVLLVIFAAGLGFGWLRGRSRAERRARADGEAGTGSDRLAQLTAAAIAGARLFEQIRRAAELAGPVAARFSAAPAERASEDVPEGQ